MKKVLAIFLTLFLLISITGCKNKENNTTDASVSENSITASDENNNQSINYTNSNNKTENTHIHQYTKATCTSAQKCTSCGKVKGSALGHKWSKATCTSAQKCTSCGKVKGSTLGHKWIEATYSTPKTCKRCKATQGEPKKPITSENPSTSTDKNSEPTQSNINSNTNDNKDTHTHEYTEATCTTAQQCISCGAFKGTALGHKWSEATYTQPKTCTLCGTTEGSPLEIPDIRGSWQAVIYNEKCKNLEKDGNHYIYTTLFQFKENKTSESKSYVMTNLFSNTFIPGEFSVKHNNINYYIDDTLKGFGAIISDIIITNSTITVIPQFEEMGDSGKYYDKIILEFNNKGNLVIKELVGTTTSHNLSELYVGLELEKTENPYF